jgi:hypothetical protein
MRSKAICVPTVLFVLVNCWVTRLAVAQIAKPAHLVVKRVVSFNLAQISATTNPGIAAAPLSAQKLQAAVLRAQAINRKLPPHLLDNQRFSVPRKEVLPKLEVIPGLAFANTNQNFTAFPAPNGPLGSLGSFENETLNAEQPIEPPDQGLCTDGTVVYEMVNLLISKFDAGGNVDSGSGFPINLNQFFQTASFSSPTDFLSDPRCYYDASTSTFFFIVTDLTAGPLRTTTQSFLLIASLNSLGNLALYQIDTSDTGNPNKSKCPCFEDEPLIGVDSYGVYLSGNEFPLNPSINKFYGAQIYAFNKADLVAQNPTLRSVVIPGPIPEAEGIAASIQPAIATDGVFDTNNGGTEYFMSTLDFVGKRDNRIAVWAMTNTSQIAGGAPTLLAPTIVNTTAYGIPPAAKQMSGLIPVGKFCGNGKQKIDTGDDRMQQVTLAGGNLYGAITTALKVGAPAAKHSGLFYIEVTPSVAGDVVNAPIVTSNYVAADKLDLYYPSIAITQAGSALMTFSLSGVKMFPSSGYLPLTADLGLFEIHTSAAGVGTYDGVSGYRGCGGFPPSRWGDYSAAIATGTTLWMASEYVSGTCPFSEWVNDVFCGETRGSGENWGTIVANVVPPGGP